MVGTVINTLFVMRPKQGGKPIVVHPQGLRIGRGSDNDLILPDAGISREHALLSYKGDRLILFDLGSRNGCFVNGRRIQDSSTLVPSDEVRIGPHTWVVVPSAVSSSIDSSQPIRKYAPRRSATTPVLLGLAVIVVLIVLLAAVALKPPQANGISDNVARQRAFASTVFLVAPQPGGANLGSGSIVEAEGLVLTNFHVIKDGNTNRPVDQVIVFLSSLGDPSATPPDRQYLAEPVAWDAKLDLAVLRIMADESGKELLPQTTFPSVVLGDSAAIGTGDALSILGFPSLGFLNIEIESLDEVTATLSRGSVSGFLWDDGVEPAWIKTDAEINRGNSGGLALDAHWRLVGVPTAVSTDLLASGKIGRLRPINLARQLLADAH